MEKINNGTFPVRLPIPLIQLMDEFIIKFKEMGIVSRQELARRAISEWLIEKKLRKDFSPNRETKIEELLDRLGVMLNFLLRKTNLKPTEEFF